MSLNKKLLAGTIVGLLFSTGASAATLGTAPVSYAAEMNVPVNLTPVPAGADIDFALGYNFSSGEFRAARFECSSAVQITTINGITLSSGNVTFGAINGLNTNAIFFSMTAVNPLAAPTNADIVTIDVGALKLVGPGDVLCQFSLYDQPSQAQAGGTTGQIYSTGMKKYITRDPSFVFAATPGTAVADVEAPAGAYTDFLFGGPGIFGALKFVPAAVMPLKADGTAITMADIFSADTTVSVDGDFTTADDVDWNGVLEDDIDDTVASWDYANAVGLDGNLEFLEGGDPIVASEYTATLHADTNAGYTVADKTVDAGKIVRNGTELQAPLAQLPTGWISRIALSNDGGSDRNYTISVLSESGVTLTTSAANLTGTIKANSVKVIELPAVITATNATNGNIRGTVKVNVSAPNNTIQGVYQIVNPDKGSISNHVMVRPGTN